MGELPEGGGGVQFTSRSLASKRPGGTVDAATATGSKQGQALFYICFLPRDCPEMPAWLGGESRIAPGSIYCLCI